MRQKKIRSNREQELESGFFAKVRKNAPVVIMIVAILGLSYTLYVHHSENENLKNQIDSSIRKADSLREAGSFEEAIYEYKGILEVVSSKKFSDRYALTQNKIGLAYQSLAEVRDAEANLEKAIYAYQEALKIHTVESYPIDYAGTQNNIGASYGGLADIKDTEANLEKAIDAYQEALKIYTVENYPVHHAQIQSHLKKNLVVLHKYQHDVEHVCVSCFSSPYKQHLFPFRTDRDDPDTNSKNLLDPVHTIICSGSYSMCRSSGS